MKHFHFIGIGGIGMSGIAEVLLNMGYKVSGTDIKASSVTTRLEAIGAVIRYEHSPENVEGADVVVYTAAVPETNPELKEARKRKIPVIPRPEMLNELMRLKVGIGVSGTHGKTTTTSLVSLIMGQAGLDPTLVVGGVLNSIGSNAKLGKSEYLVFEACEAFGSLSYFSPQIIAVTNIDDDHLEYYKNMDSLKEAFLCFINRIPFFGFAALNGDDKYIQSLLPYVTKKYTSFGLGAHNDVQAKNIDQRKMRGFFELFISGEKKADMELNLPGIHNVYNALAAITIGLELGVSIDCIQKALASFDNADRRFQFIGEFQNVKIIDDYAHHPSEVKATIEAALFMKQNGSRRVIAIFQPHLYSRTKMLYERFASSLELADHVFLTDIYPAREKPIPGVSTQLISDTMKEHQYHNVTFIPEKTQLPKAVKEFVQPGDVVLTLGAGDIHTYGSELLDLLKNKV